MERYVREKGSCEGEKSKKKAVVGRAQGKEGQQTEEVKSEEERRRVETCCQLRRGAGGSTGRMRGAARAVRRSGAGGECVGAEEKN